jgi:hypothetical protein
MGASGEERMEVDRSGFRPNIRKSFERYGFSTNIWSGPLLSAFDSNRMRTH